MEGEKPWDSTYQYQCKKKMFEKHKEELGESRAVALANVWANYHFLGMLANVWANYHSLGMLASYLSLGMLASHLSLGMLASHLSLGMRANYLILNIF